MEKKIEANFTELGKLYYQKELCKIAISNLMNDQLKLIKDIAKQSMTVLPTSTTTPAVS